MTKKLFWEDPYLAGHETVVASVDRDTVTLRETIFYAFSGGQESDQGTIGGHQVLEARKAGLDIEYLLPAGHGLFPGDRVQVKIDWARRYSLMRLHFAAELILELVYRELAEVVKIGAHIAPDKARLDFLWPDNIAGLFPKLTDRAHEFIGRDLAIVSAFTDESRQIRYWEVPGLGRVPCGGTHPKRTGEVGRLLLRRRNIGRDKERIEVYLRAEA